MRKITELACEAFEDSMPFKRDNTEVDIDPEGDAAMYLFGNLIARVINNVTYISLAGWNTPTTRERLNGLTGVSITRLKGQTYLNGLKWNGKWEKI